MSNSPLQNAGFETFSNIAAFEDPDFEDDFFGGIPSFTQDIWTNSKCKGMENDDDLPLTKYLLQFNDDEGWNSEEEQSMEGDSFECERGGFGWDIDPIDLDANAFEDSGLTQDTPDKPKQGKEEVVVKERNSVGKSTKMKKSDHKEGKCNYDLDENESLKKRNPGKNTVKFHSVQSKEISTKAVAQCKEVFKKSTNSTAEKQKPLSTSKTQAEKAKQQRERKKKYIQELEDTIETLKRDKAMLKQASTQLHDKIEGLQDEIHYLKGVIQNQSELATILRSVANTPGISISCGVLQDSGGSDGKANKRKYNDHAEDSGEKDCNMHHKRNKRKKEESSGDKISSTDAGVCVHVQSGKVSLEFCAECSKKANGAIN